MVKNLNNLILNASQYYQQLLNIKPKRTKLQILSKKEWQQFCQKINLNYTSEGFFLLRNLTAYLLKESKNMHLNLFHEYFGHGLFCEYSKQGKFLEKLEKRLEREEKQKFKGKKFSLQEIQEFRKQNPNFILLQKEKKSNLYEIFAIWTEHYLSELFEMKDKFNKKYKNIPKEVKDNLEKMLNFQKNYGELVLFYEIGMPKYYDANKIKNLLEQLFKEKTKSMELVLLYGSKKPYSDIDLFIVSKEIENFSNRWLDIYSLNPKEFEYSLSVFCISVTDPILTGEFVLGNREYLEKKKRQLQEQPITKEAIYYNLIKAKEQKIYAESYSNDLEKYSKAMSYAETYLKNALALMQGKRKLTKESLLKD